MISLSSKRYFFFDLDDTLINTSTANKFGMESAYNQLSRLCDEDLSEILPFEKFEAEIKKVYREKKFYDYEPEVFEEYCKNIISVKKLPLQIADDSLAARLYWHFRETKYKALMPLKNAFDLIIYLKQMRQMVKQELLLFCITSGRCHYQHTKLMLTGLEGKFDSLIISSQKGNYIEGFLNMKNINKEMAVMVGDRADDIDAGHYAQIDAIRILFGDHKEEKPVKPPEMEFSGLGDLLKALKNQESNKN